MSEQSKLRWKSRRGMKELDVLLESYLQNHYSQADQEHQQAFAQLLELQDPELAAYLLGGSLPADEITADVVKQIRARH